MKSRGVGRLIDDEMFQTFENSGRLLQYVRPCLHLTRQQPAPDHYAKFKNGRLIDYGTE